MTIIIAEGLCKSTNRGDSAGRCGKDRTHEFVENSQAASGGPHGVPAGGIADHGAAGRVDRPRCADGGHRYKLYFPHAEAYLLAWLFLFLIWLLLDWIFRLPPLSTLGMAVLGCVPCAVNFYTLQLRGEPFLPWDLAQVSEAAGVASAAGIRIQTSMIVTVVVELALMAGSFSCTVGGINSAGCPVWRAVRPPQRPCAC